jgi:four helix bundle protein
MKYDLEERLINYSVLILDIVDTMPGNKGANHLASQIIRSGTAPALMYGEAQSSESRKDFIHKMRLSLKELRETYNCLKIIDRKQYTGNADKLIKGLKESHELISIFVKSIGTAIENAKVKT